MSKKLTRLFEPYKIGKVTIKNRFSMAPMGFGGNFESNGAFSEEGINYYAERARGSFGLIFVGASLTDLKVDPPSTFPALSPLVNSEDFMRSALRLTDRVHEYGSKVFAQITLGLGRNYPGLKAPSEVDMFGAPGVKTGELTKEEIKQKLDGIVQAAVLMKSSGFDGVEIHALHWGYLLDQFAMSITNQRTDEYGGSLENRLRITKEVLDEIKKVCGNDFPVSIRLGMKSYIKGLNQASLGGSNEVGRTLEEGVEICKLLEAYGYDTISIDAGIYDSFYYAAPPMYMPKGFTIELAKAAKKVTKIPILVGGSRIDEPQLCLDAVEEDTGDAIVMGRAALADPYLPRKMEMGKIEDIRPCIGCNHCMYSLFKGANCECAVNPTIDHEEQYRLIPALSSKKIVVVGGGLAGMESARIAKLRGHDVSIYEKTANLGGNLLAAGAHDFKNDVKRLNDWYKKEVKNLSIPVHFDSELTVNKLLEIKPDVAIMATGSIPVELKFNGSGDKKVISCLDAIFEKKPVGDKVIIVGGGQIGCEIAIDYGKQGKDVTIVEALDNLLSSGAAVPVMNTMALMDMMVSYGIKMYTGARLESVDATGANIFSPKENKSFHLDADTVIMSVGFKANSLDVSPLVGSGIDFYEVGDGRKVGDVSTTISGAFAVSRLI